jgi:hypothetical protein
MTINRLIPFQPARWLNVWPSAMREGSAASGFSEAAFFFLALTAWQGVKSDQRLIDDLSKTTSLTFVD